jgi:hypothetical protein
MLTKNSARPVARRRKDTPYRDLRLAIFVEERMPSERKRSGIPKSLLYEAKKKFGLSSKSAILRAYSRGKRIKKSLYSSGCVGIDTGGFSSSTTPEGSVR